MRFMSHLNVWQQLKIKKSGSNSRRTFQVEDAYDTNNTYLSVPHMLLNCNTVASSVFVVTSDKNTD